MNIRRFLWTVLVASVVVMALTMYLQKQAQQPPQAPSQPARPAETAPTAAPPATGAAEAPTPAPPPAAAVQPAQTPQSPSTWGNSTYTDHQVILGSRDRRTGFKMQLELVNRGAAVKTLKLSEFHVTVADKRRWEKDPDTYDQALYEGDDKELKGYYPLLNPVGSGPTMIYPLATRRIRFPDFERGNNTLDLSGPRWRAGPVTTGTDGSHSATFTSYVTRNGKPFVRLEKTYTLPKESYSATVKLRVVNQSKNDGKVRFSLTQFAATGVPREGFRSDQRALVYGQREDKEIKVNAPGIAQAQKRPVGLKNKSKIGRSDEAKAMLWIGQANRFFAVLTYVHPQPPSQADKPAPEQALAAEFFSVALQESATWRTHLAGIDLGPYKLDPGEGQAHEVSMDLFAGPKRRDLLDSTPLYAKLEYKKAIQFGRCCSWGPLSLAMMWLLDLFSKAMLGNYGLAIILLVVLVRLLLHPLTKKGQVSMMGMQKLQPKMQEIREKYKNDKAKLNEEMMKLYKTAGGTPLLGCLPMLLQMPIWIALWTGIQAAVELRHAPFLPIWITDLASPDALISFGGASLRLPLVGNMTGDIVSLNLLPLLVTVAFFLQSKLSPSAAAAAGSDQQARTQKQMMYMMPAFMLLIFYNAPSGLNLYIMASSFAGAAEQYIIRKHIRQREEAEAAVETRVSMPGKRFRGQKPKKPKGPFRMTH